MREFPGFFKASSKAELAEIYNNRNVTPDHTEWWAL
jgi:hypothetical protein